MSIKTEQFCSFYDIISSTMFAVYHRKNTPHTSVYQLISGKVQSSMFFSLKNYFLSKRVQITTETITPSCSVQTHKRGGDAEKPFLFHPAGCCSSLIASLKQFQHGKKIIKQACDQLVKWRSLSLWCGRQQVHWLAGQLIKILI